MNNAVGHNAPDWLCIESRAYDEYWNNDVRQIEAANTLPPGYLGFDFVYSQTGITEARLKAGRASGEIRVIKISNLAYFNEADIINYLAKPKAKKMNYVELTCDRCGKKFERLRSKIDWNKRKYCSIHCCGRHRVIMKDG